MELNKRFAVNYYQWAKAEFQREINHEYPLLSTLRCSASLKIYEFMLTLPVDDRRKLALALSKRGNQEAALLCDEPFSDYEKELLHAYSRHNVMEYPIIGSVYYCGPSKRAQEIEEAIKSKQLSAQHSNKTFRAAVLKRVSETLGGTPSIDQFGIITHVAEANDWKIITSVALEGKFPMRYTQFLTTSSGLYQETSFLRWMGIMGDTLWDLVTTDVTEDAIEQLVALCARFLSEGPKLLTENVT